MARPKGSKNVVPAKRRSLWTEYEREILRDQYYKMTIKDLGKLLNKAKSTIKDEAKRQGLSKKGLRKIPKHLY